MNGDTLEFHSQSQKLERTTLYSILNSHHRKVLLSSFRLNGYSLGFHPRTLTSESPVMFIQIHGYPDRTFLLPLFFVFVCFFFRFTEDVTALKANKAEAEDDLNAEETSREDEDELTQEGHELKDMLERDEGRSPGARMKTKKIRTGMK